MEEVISLDKVDLGGPSISLDEDPKSVDFGMGLELLMNDKHKKGGDKPSKDAADELKKELDDITAINLNAESSGPSISEPASVSIPQLRLGINTKYGF